MLDLRIEDLDALAKPFFAGEISIQPAADRYSRQEIIQFLRENVRALEEEISGMSAAQLAYRMPGSPTGPDASGDEEHFDASQIATHVASGLTFHWWGIARALGHERPAFTRPPEGTQMTGSKGNVMGGGGWGGATAKELSRLLNETAARFLAYLEALREDLDSAATARFANLGVLNAHGWMFLAAIHPAMHLHQLRVMQVQPDFPG